LITWAGCVISYNLVAANHEKPAENKMQAIQITPVRTITMPSQSLAQESLEKGSVARYIGVEYGAEHRSIAH
jgi:hypothetical protein